MLRWMHSFILWLINYYINFGPPVQVQSDAWLKLMNQEAI